MKTEIVSVASNRWPEALCGTVHDVYQLPGWSSASSLIDGGEAAAVIVSAGSATCVAPFLRRSIDGSSWDASSAYGYAGPVWSPDLAEEQRTELLRGAADALAEAGAVSWFVRLHPMLAGVESAPGGLIVDHGPTVAIDLSVSAEERWKSIRSGHKADIVRARRAGCEVEMDEDLDAIAEFADLYRETMRRIGSSDYYGFGDDYFEALKRSLRGDLVLARASLNGRLIGGALFTLSKASGLVGYHLSASVPLDNNLQPTKLLIDHVQGWAADLGYRALHLGGGLGALEGSLYRFKRGFSALTYRFRSARFVLDPVRYQLLAGAGEERSGFFPLYRSHQGAETESAS